MNDRAAVVLDGGRGLAGSTHLGLQADGVGWGLHYTGLSHMAPNHTEPLGNNTDCGARETIGVCPLISGQMFGVFLPGFLLWVLAENQKQASLWDVQSKR